MSHGSGHSATILFKRSDSDNSPGTILTRGEPAYTFGAGAPNPSANASGQRLFIGVPNGVGGNRSAIIGGEYYTKKMDHTPGVLQTSLASDNSYGTVVLVDSVGVIDQWRVDNLRFGENDSNTITTSTGNLILNSQTGVIVFSGAVLDSISSFTADSASFKKISVDSNLNVTTLEVTDSAHIEFFSADSAYIDSATIDDVTVTNTATINNATVNYLDADSADIGLINISGTTIKSTSADTNNTIVIDPNPLGDSGTLVIRGNLTIEGTTTTVNSTEVSINDKTLVLGDSTAAANYLQLSGAGIQIGDSETWGSTAAPLFSYYNDNTDSEFQVNRNFHVVGTTGSNGNISADSADFGKLDVTGLSTFNQVNADSVYIRTFDFDSGHIDSVDIDRTHIDYADIDSAHIDSVDIDRTHIDFADIDSAHIDSAGIDRLQVDSASITNLTATNASFTNISGVDSAHFTTLTTDSATFDILRITDSVGLKTLFDSTDFIFIDAPGAPQVALKAEAIEDFVGAMVGSSISVQNKIHVRYDDSGGAIDFTVPLAGAVSSFNATAPLRGDSDIDDVHPDTSTIANGAGLAKFNDSDFRVTVSTGYVEINQVDGGTF